MASSTACLVAVIPPTATWSNPTVPEAPLPSPYEMSQDAPSYSSQVSLLVESKAEWSPRSLDERAVLNTQLFNVSTVNDSSGDKHLQIGGAGVEVQVELLTTN